jgi:hypothetical protein
LVRFENCLDVMECFLFGGLGVLGLWVGGVVVSVEKRRGRRIFVVGGWGLWIVQSDRLEGEYVMSMVTVSWLGGMLLI